MAPRMEELLAPALELALARFQRRKVQIDPASESPQSTFATDHSIGDGRAVAAGQHAVLAHGTQRAVFEKKLVDTVGMKNVAAG